MVNLKGAQGKNEKGHFKQGGPIVEESLEFL